MLGFSATLNGVQLGSDTYGIMVVRDRVPLMPESNVNVFEVPYSFGGVSDQSFFKPLPMTLSCVMSAPSNDALKSQVDSLNLLLYQRRAVLSTLQLDRRPDRYWNVRVTGGASAAPAGATNYEFALPFIAPDPRAYDLSATTQTASISSDPDTVLMPAAGVIGGTVTADPVWYIRNETGGVLATVTLANATTSDTLVWTGVLPDDAWLRVDSGNTTQLVQVSDGIGADPVAEDYTNSMDITGTFPTLEAGSQNSISVTGVSAGSFQATYTKRYLS